MSDNTKKPYLVGVREVHVQYYKVDAASSEQEAISIIEEQLRTNVLELQPIAFEYSHTLGSDKWTAEEDKSK